MSLLFFIGCKNENLLISVPEKDQYFGEIIEDPYRNAEDLENSEVHKWVEEENKIAKKYLNSIKKRTPLIERQLEFDKKTLYTVTDIQVLENDNYFYLKRNAGENTAKLYFRKTFNEPEILLYDPNKFNKETYPNINYVINYFKPNWNGTKVVVSLTEEGKEISNLIIIDVLTREVLPEVLTNSWVSAIGGITWLPDNSKFIYVYHPITDPKSPKFLKNTKSVLYKIGNTKNDLKEVFSKTNNEDLVIKEEDFPTISLQSSTSKYLIGQITGEGGYNDAYIIPIEEINSKNWKVLFKRTDQIKDFIIKKDTLYYITSKNAPNFEIRKTSLKNIDFLNSEVLVKEKKDSIITDFKMTSEGLFYVTSKNGIKADLYRYKQDKTEVINLPQVFGNITLTTKSINHPELWIKTRGWITQSNRFEYKFGRLTEKNLNPLNIEDYNLDDIVIQELEVEAHDGKKIPLSLIYKKSLTKDGRNYTMMDGYGAYGVSMIPFFSLRRLLWVKEGGIYAIAHVRGGGEKGDAWHKGGFKTTKPNTWKDFISCAEYLIDNKFTNSDKLAIWSGSAGGIMIGRAITERPNLFKAAIVEFGMLNTLRSESRPNGANSVKEYGTIKDSTEYKALKEMDAYHHLEKGKKYPSTLLTAGLNDPRVPAWFSVKFAARIKDSNNSNNPNLLLIDKESGHGEDDTKFKEFERYANILSFAFWQTGHPDYQPKN